jgi:hypothetical protein
MRRGKVGPLGITQRLDDDTIDKIVIPYTIVKAILEADGRDPSDFQEKEAVRAEIRDAIADGMDDLEEALGGKKLPVELGENGNPLEDAAAGKYYTWTREGFHQIRTEDWDIMLRADGLRVRTAVMLDTD